MTAGRSTIRFCPPLVLTAEEAAVALTLFETALAAVAATPPAG